MSERTTLVARHTLATIGVRTPRDLALWARQRGVLSVFLAYTPVQHPYPAAWQVVRPGYDTDPLAEPWQQGRKTFCVYTVNDRSSAEQAARVWASVTYAVDRWVKIDGLGKTLFPDTVAIALRPHLPGLTVKGMRGKRTLVFT
jgi:hypothetical protein